MVQTNNLISIIDENYYFDFNPENQINPLVQGLETIDLSNNNLKNFPSFLYKLKNLRQIYFNGNLLKKIPNELYQGSRPSAEHDANFERLKKLQELRVKEEKKKNAEEDFDEDEDEQELKKKKKKLKNKLKQEPPKIEPLQDIPEAEQEPQVLLSDTLEILHLNNNQLEHVPENLFSYFKSLKEIKLLNNPLKDPPQESICISSGDNKTTKLARNEPETVEFMKHEIDDSKTTITLLEKDINANKDLAAFNYNFNKKNTIKLFNQQVDLSYYSIASDREKKI